MAASDQRLRLRATFPDIARTVRDEWRFLLPTALVVFVPLGLLDAVADEFQGTKIENVDLVSGLFLSGATLAHYLAAGLGDQFYAGAVAAAVSESRSRARRHSLLEIARTVPYARLIAIDLIVSVGTALGLILLIVPGLVFYTWFALAAPVVKIERLGVRASLARSRELVRGSFWQVLALLALAELAGDALTSVGEDGALWAVGKSFLGDWVAAVVTSVLVTPLTAVAAVVVTYELIELKSPLQQAPSPPPSR